MNRKKRNFLQCDVKLLEMFPGASSENQFLRIIRGIILPSVVAGYGVYSCIMRNSILPGKRGRLLELHNTTAVIYGIALIGLAMFLHFCFWWSAEHPKYKIAKNFAIVAMVIFLLAFGITFWRIICFKSMH